MGIVRVNPFRAMDMMARDMQRAMRTFDSASQCVSANFSPKIDISEDENKIYLSAEMPGIAKEDVTVTINDDNLLIIKGEKKASYETKSEETVRKEKLYIRTERSYGTFTRTFMLPENIVNDSIKANYNNGILDITIDKKEPEKPKEILVDII